MLPLLMAFAEITPHAARCRCLRCYVLPVCVSLISPRGSFARRTDISMPRASAQSYFVAALSAAPCRCLMPCHADFDARRCYIPAAIRADMLLSCRLLPSPLLTGCHAERLLIFHCVLPRYRCLRYEPFFVSLMSRYYADAATPLSLRY